MITRHLRIAILIAVSISLTPGAPSSAQAPDRFDAAAELQAATEAYDRGVRMLDADPDEAAHSLRRAVAGYERLIGSGVHSGRLYSIAGNAYFLLGDMGFAILNYVRAERLMPRDANLHANLALARSRVKASIEAPLEAQVADRLHAIVRVLPARQFAWAAITMWSLGWLVLLARLHRRSIPRRIPLALLVVSTLSAIASIAPAWVNRHDSRAVVISPESVGRKGPDAQAYPPSFSSPLPAGVEVLIIEERPGWRLIRLADGRETWLPERESAPVQPGD